MKHRHRLTVFCVAGGIVAVGAGAAHAVGAPVECAAPGSVSCAPAIAMASDSPPPSATPSASSSPQPEPSATATATATASPDASASAGGAAVMADQPRPDCFSIRDGEGDANANVAAGLGRGTDDDLDITAVNFRTNDADLQAFVRVKALGSPASPYNGHVFTVTFTVNNKKVELSASSSTAASATVGGAAVADAKPKAVFDVKASNVVITVDRAALAKAVGTALTEGVVVTATAATSAATAAVGGPYPADTAQADKPEDRVYTLGDNACFYPPAALLDLQADAGGQYGDPAEISVALADPAGEPLVGRAVTARIGAAQVTGTTDEEGMATLMVRPNDKAGPTSLSVVFAGEAAIGPAKAGQPFTITAEASRLQARGSKGTVTATLVGDHRAPIRGQTIVFRSGPVTKTARTAANGSARAAGFTAGASVTVSYRGSAGYYTAAASVTTPA